ncbi:MFS transporter [Photobacterium leiognathi subsp. mandapamensis]|uniref:MFS transporter n=1 Tax=Photobacterium leiognathi TaxID=553611 RepID=UPI003AF390DF
MKNKSNYRWFVLSVGVLAQATFAMSFAGIPVTGVLMRDAYQFNLFELGVVLGSMGLGVALSEIIWGILTDKLGDKTVLIIGLWLAAGTFLGIALMFTPETQSSVSYLGLSAMLMASGVFSGSINSSSGRTVMSWFDDSERGFAMSIRQTAIPIGGAIGTGLLPWVTYSYGFKTTFLLLALMGLLVGAFVLFFVRSKHQPSAFNAQQANTMSPLKSVDVWKVTLAAGFLTVPQMSVITFGGVYLRDNLSLGLTSISVILIGIQIGGGALRIWSGRYTDKHKNRIPLLKQISVVGGIAAIALCGLADQTVLGIVFLIATGLIGHAWHGIAYTEAAVKAGVERAGTALGMIGTTVFLSSFLSPILVSSLLKVTSWNFVWAVVGVLTLLALPFFSLSESAKIHHATVEK